MDAMTMLLKGSAAHSTLARLSIRVPAAAPLLEDGTHQQLQLLAHQLQLIKIIQEKLPADLAAASLAYACTSDSIQYVCHKGNVAKLYKSLAGLRQQLGFQVPEVRNSISLQPMPIRQLDNIASEAITEALLRAHPAAPAPTRLAAAAAGLFPSRSWHMLQPGCFISTDVLASAPGSLCHALYVELDVSAQQPDKLLLNFAAAGVVKYRLFSIQQALLTERSNLPSPLQVQDNDADILSNTDKLKVANKLLHGRTCHVFPMQQPAVVTKVLPATAALLAESQQRLKQRLDDHSLHQCTLPRSIPFLVEVAPHAESDDSCILPSCCVLTSLGISSVLPTAPEYVGAASVQQLVVSDICTSGLQLWGPAGLSALGASQASVPDAPAAFTYKAGWSSAKHLEGQDLSLLQLQPVDPGNSSHGAAADPSACCMASDVPDAAEAAQAARRSGLAADALGQQYEQGVPAGDRRRPPRPATDYSALKAFLAKQQQQQQAGDHAQAGQGSGPQKPAVTSKLAGSSLTAATSRPAHAPAGVGVAPPAAPRPLTLQQKLAAGKSGGGVVKPAVPALKKAAVSTAAGAVGKAPAVKRPAAAALAGAAQGTAGAGGPAAAAKPPKKPRAAGKAAKLPSDAPAPPPPARPAAAAASATAVEAATVQLSVGPAAAAAAAGTGAPAPGGLHLTAAMPATDSSTPAAATATAAALQCLVAADLAAAAAAVVPAAAGTAATAAAAPPPPAAVGAAAAAAAAPPRKRVKAADLDLAAVTEKLRTAVAAGGGFKGVSVPELQCYLKAHKLGVSGKKVELEAKATAHFSQSGAAGGATG